jgi:Tol biopolymer transport system component
MKNSNRMTTVILTCLLLMLVALPAKAQLPSDPAERERVIAQIFEANASQLTLFDRTGKEITRIGSRDLYSQPVLSPDMKRVAVIKADIDKETNDLWVLDLDTGKATRITTTTKAREGVSAPAWSPDGKELAYIALRNSAFELTRKQASGDGPEEVLYKHAGSPITLTQWSLDGKLLLFSSNDLSGGILYALPPTGDRKPVQFLKSEKQIRTPRVSPDNRFVAYPSNDSGRVEIYARAFDPSRSIVDTAEGRSQVSDQGSLGMVFWRHDGKELYYLGADRSIMYVEVKTSPGLEFGKPKQLFRPSEATPITPGGASVSRDGERILLAVPPPQLRQLTVFDREGKVVTKVGPPGLYVQPGIAPDGKTVVVMRTDPQTSNVDIWTYDLTTGKGTAVTDDIPPENAPIWSPDGKQIAYASTRGNYSSIYVKSADGTGEEETLFRYTPGAGMVLTDWSPDGKFITFYTGVLLLVPLGSNQPALERKAIEWLREDYDVVQGRFSPDGRYASKPDAPPPGAPIQVSKNGAIGMLFWRQDGKEMYFMTRDWEVMAVDVSTTPTFQAGTPKVLFKLQGPLPGNPGQWKNVSRDGQRFIFAMPIR